jgi:soluble lytic murein transglycosylase-like protein
MNKLYVVLVTSLVILLGGPQRVESDTSTVPYYIYNAATHFNIDIALMYSICMVESNCRARAVNHNDGTPAQKAAGIVDKSYGLFQIKTATAKNLGFIIKEDVTVEKFRRGKVVKTKKTIDHTKDLLKPEINAWYAAKLLSHLYERYHDTPKVISAYNAGHYIKSNKDYVRKVLVQFVRYKIDRK